MAKVILFRGKAGVGKTTISNEISRLICIPIIRKDDIYDKILESLIDHNKRNEFCENEIRNQIKTKINQGESIIVDNSYHNPVHFQKFREWLTRENIGLISILVICSNEDIWKERFNHRAIHPKPNNLIIDFDQLKEHYGNLYTEPYDNELILDSTKSIGELSNETIKWIKQNL